jgi:hypothetical protein
LEIKRGIVPGSFKRELKMDIKLVGKKLTIVVEDVTKSIKSTEKMELSASSGGFQGVGTVDGKAIKVSCLVGWKR